MHKIVKCEICGDDTVQSSNRPRLYCGDCAPIAKHMNLLIKALVNKKLKKSYANDIKRELFIMANTITVDKY